MWRRIAWVAAFALALGGGALYLVVGSDAAWWIGGLMGGPLCVLVMLRAERVGDQLDPRASFQDPGPLGPP